MSSEQADKPPTQQSRTRSLPPPPLTFPPVYPQCQPCLPPSLPVGSSKATASVREFQEPEMTAAPQPSLSCYLSLDLPPVFPGLPPTVPVRC